MKIEDAWQGAWTVFEDILEEMDFWELGRLAEQELFGPWESWDQLDRKHLTDGRIGKFLTLYILLRFRDQDGATPLDHFLRREMSPGVRRCLEEMKGAQLYFVERSEAGWLRPSGAPIALIAPPDDEGLLLAWLTAKGRVLVSLDFGEVVPPHVEHFGDGPVGLGDAVSAHHIWLLRRAGPPPDRSAERAARAAREARYHAEVAAAVLVRITYPVKEPAALTALDELLAVGVPGRSWGLGPEQTAYAAFDGGRLRLECMKEDAAEGAQARIEAALGAALGPPLTVRENPMMSLESLIQSYGGSFDGEALRTLRETALRLRAGTPHEALEGFSPEKAAEVPRLRDLAMAIATDTTGTDLTALLRLGPE